MQRTDYFLYFCDINYIKNNDMTLHEIEERILAITNQLKVLEKESKVLEKKEEEYNQLFRNKKKQDNEYKIICNETCDGWIGSNLTYVSEHIELRSKIYKLEEELNDLYRQRLQIKQQNEIQYKYCNSHIDNQFIITFLKEKNIEYTTIDFMDEYSVRIKCPNSQLISFVTGQSISSDLYVGQTIYS